MIPINFPGAFIRVDKPPNLTDEECMSGVPAWAGEDTQSGKFCFLFAWRPNREDLQAINAGKPIFVKIFADPVPPHTIFTLDDDGIINSP